MFVITTIKHTSIQPCCIKMKTKVDNTRQITWINYLLESCLSFICPSLPYILTGKLLWSAHWRKSASYIQYARYLSDVYVYDHKLLFLYTSSNYLYDKLQTHFVRVSIYKYIYQNELWYNLNELSIFLHLLITGFLY